MNNIIRAGTTGLAVSLAVATALTAAASTGNAAPSPTRAHGERTLRLTQQFGETFGLDLGDSGPSIGDEFGGSSIWSMNGHVVARAGFTCTSTSLQPPEDQCILSARFANGILTAQTLFEEQSSAPTDYAITGGSLAYRDATGYLTITNGASQITIHLDAN